MTFPADELTRLRAETPGCAERIHLNNAGAGLMPAPVLSAITEHLELEARIGGYEAADVRASAVEDTYRAVAALLDCAPRNVAMVENATVGFQQALLLVGVHRPNTHAVGNRQLWHWHVGGQEHVLDGAHGLEAGRPHGWLGPCGARRP